jgi:hypothetical protein
MLRADNSFPGDLEGVRACVCVCVCQCDIEILNVRQLKTEMEWSATEQ